MLSYKRIILVGLGLFCMGSFADRYALGEEDIHQQVQAISGEKDYFADYMEMRGRLTFALSKKLRKIKLKHQEEISKGEYQNYLDNLTKFLQGYKEARPIDSVEGLLRKVKSLRFDLMYEDVKQGKEVNYAK
ncbi:MAG: hypothetical protein HRT87_06580 [Legionellales bacterium]|nr:hypothetical protein [Legionellales bacterium]